ncbi:MAG: glycosyltransferase [Candidatus Hydrogenedentota bacterium]
MATLTLAICARNAQHIIGACLESVVTQTVQPQEVIVSLDSLDDPTVEVAKQFGARVIASNVTGLYEARNAVLHTCSTDYLAFTDADCELVPEWVATAKRVLDERPRVAAVTGRHPPVGKRNLAAWLHHMWYVVETAHTGPIGHVIGGNSVFRTQALRDVGGWLNLPGHSAAEDMYISEALRRAGWEIWFQEELAARHNYETRLSGLWRKSVMMGRDIVVMMRVSGFQGGLWGFTMRIPIAAANALTGTILGVLDARLWAAVLAAPLLASFAYFLSRFKTLRATFPRWLARWVLIWPYSWGILQGLASTLPPRLSARTQE